MRTRKRALLLAGLAVFGLAAAAVAENINMPEWRIWWFKNGIYIGAPAKTPNASTLNKMKGAFGYVQTIDVAFVDGGSCVDTVVTQYDGGASAMPGATMGDPCFVGAPPGAANFATFSCYVPDAGAVTLRTCAGTSVDPANAAYNFRIISSQ